MASDLSSALAKLSGQVINLTFADTSNKSYNKLQAFRNVTSYSMLGTLHSCPRKFQLIKARASAGGSQANNVDFAYGHAVGSGVQAWMIKQDINEAIMNATMAWTLPFGASVDKKKKSLPNAVIAVLKYVEFYQQSMEDWEIWVLPSGKPAIELSIAIDFENGYKHYIHIDAILINKISGKLAVQENKTSGFKDVEAAIYANSSQALSYACVVDMLSENTSYEVFYCVYSSVDRLWSLLPFTKHTSLKAEWIMDAKLDHATLETYHNLNFYPKRGEACYEFMRRCEFFGSCNMTNTLKPPPELPAGDEAEPVDYSFTISDIIARQKVRNQDAPPDEQDDFDSMDLQPAGITRID